MAWAIITLILNTVAQLLLKLSTRSHERLFSILPWITWPFIFAMAIYVASVLTWLQALKIMPLSQAYPFMAAALITVPIASIFIGETLIPIQWVFLSIAAVSIGGFALFSR